jgi:hypothetical protein
MLTPIDRDAFDAAQAAEPSYYVEERWPLYHQAIGIASGLASAGEQILEIGPYRLPLFARSTILDRERHEAIVPSPRDVYERDAGNLPWPIKSRRFKVCIALQVFEHFGKIRPTDSLSGWYGAIQPLVFLEIARTCEHALISVPWLWVSGDIRHRWIGPQVFESWTRVFPWEACWDVGSRRLFHFDFTSPEKISQYLMSEP